MYNDNGNTNAGFTENNNGMPTSTRDVFNNLSYFNDYGFVTFGNNVGIQRDNNYTNNLAYDNHVLDEDDNDHAGGNFNTEVTNSWNDPPDATVTAADFVTLDTTGMMGVRGVNNTLPSTNFGKLAEGSDLISVGTDVGLSFNGAAPDLGWFESNYSASTTRAMTGSGGVASVVNGNIAIKEE